MPKIISANRLADGTVVYLGPDRSWTEVLDHADCFTDDAAADGLTLARDHVKRNLVIDPFLVEVTAPEEGPRPVSLRNRIRARGPTVDYLPRAVHETARTDRS